MPVALQDLCLPEGMCYGCGSANPDGLHLKSYWSDDGQYVVAAFDPLPKFMSLQERRLRRADRLVD